MALKSDGSVVAWGDKRLRPDDGARRGAERSDGDCGGRRSHRGLEERRLGPGVGRQRSRPDDGALAAQSGVMAIAAGAITLWP